MKPLYTAITRVNTTISGTETTKHHTSNRLSFPLLILLFVLFSTNPLNAQTLIAGWDFQTTTTGGTAAATAPASPKVYVANFGSGTIYFDGTNNSSNWFVGSSNSELNAFGGTSINAGAGFSTVTSGAASLALVAGAAQAANGKYAIFKFSMTGFINLAVSFAAQKTTTGFSTQTWEYSTNGTTWTLLQTVTTVPSSFGVITLPVTAGLNGAANAYLRLSGTGATTATGNNRLDNIQLTATPGVTFNTDPISGSPFCISDDKSAAVSVSFFYGGTPNAGNVYTAQLSSSTGSFASPVNIGILPSVLSSGTISATIPAGTASGNAYRIRVVSSDPANTGADNGTNLVIDKVVATATNNGPVCIGSSIQLFAGGGTTYNWTGPNAFVSGIQNPLLPVTVAADSGDYLVSAVSALGCTDTAFTLAIIQDCGCVPPTINSSTVMPSCYGGSNGSIDITVLGGVAPFAFSWSTGATTEDISGVGAGVYSVIVTDAVLCTDTFFVSVSAPTLINSATVITQPGCQGYNNGSIDLTVTGGTSPYTYLWDNGALTEDISGLAAGLYSVSITDANGCTSNNFGVVADPGVFTLNAVPMDETCFGNNNGAINVTASNDTVNTSNPGLLISEFHPDPAGTDSSKEWVELIATKFINFAITPYTVIVANNGTATASGWVQGGLASATTNSTYAFEISTGSVVPGDVVYVGGINMAVSGNKVRVKNISTTVGDGGIGSATTAGIIGNGGTNADAVAVFMGAASALTAASIPKDAVFFGSAMGSAVVSGGTAGFTLPVNDNYNGGFLQNGSFLVSNPTTSYVKASGTYNVLSGAYSQRVWSLAATATNGTSEIAVTSGNSYVWSNGATTEDINGLSAGSYTVTATSPTGCTATVSATINAATATTVSGTVFNVTCFGLSDGGIDVSVSGGALPYSYFWNDGAVTEDRSAIPAGVYTLTITDANACTVTTSYTVVQPFDISYTTISDSTSCFGAADGGIDLSLSGGTPPYSFSWSNGDTTEDIFNQPASFYFFNIADANGCGTGGIEFINDPNPIVISAFTPNSGGSGVQVTINGSGFTGATAVLFDAIPAASFSVISDNLIQAVVPVGADTGFISVATSLNCISAAVDTFFYDPTACVPPVLSALASATSCFGASDGSVDLTISGGTQPYNINWSNGSTSEDIAGLFAGTYTVIVSDVSSCPDTLSVVVSQPAQLIISGVVDSVNCNGGADGSIDISITGGTAPFVYSWSNGSATEDLTALGTGTYTVVVLDAGSCAATTDFTVFEPSVLTTAVSFTNPVCTGDASGSINPLAGGGTPPYTYAWSNGASTAILNGVVAGTYTVLITDAKGCFINTGATLTDPPAFTLSVNAATDVSCFGASTGAIDIAASNDPLLPPANPGLLISEFLPDPAGVDHPFEWVELIATKAIDFSVTPYTVVVANNGTATTKGWRAGGTITYAFQISNGVVNPGDVFYVGGSSMAPTGTKLRTINTLTTAGDGFGSLNGGGIGNAGTNADAVAVFNVPSAAIDSTTIPTDAIFFGAGRGSAIVNGGLNGYTLPTNDRYAGGLFNAASYIVTTAASISGSHLVANGAFNFESGIFTTARTWTLSPTFTNAVSAVTVSANNTYLWSNGASTQDISNLPAGTYTLTATNASGCIANATLNINQPNDMSLSGFIPSSGNAGTVVTISGGGFTGADEVMFNGLAAAFTIDNDGQITATAPAGVSTGLITVINSGCDTIVSVNPFTISTNATLNLTMLIEGYYDGAGGMVPVLLNSGAGVSNSECDSILVEIRDQTSPATVLASTPAILSTSGQATVSLPSLLIGQSVYIAVFHRNAVQTWSNLVSITPVTAYDFTTSALQSYGPNMIEVSTGLWAFYSGDVDQDEFVGIVDQGIVDNDVFNFAGGYVVTDITGNGFVDIIDQGLLDNNIFNFIGSVHP